MLLKFKDGARDVLTTAWTAVSANKGNAVDIAYLWGADGLSLFQSATGTSRYLASGSFRAFNHYVEDCASKGKTIDLTIDWARRFG